MSLKNNHKVLYTFLNQPTKTKKKKNLRNIDNESKQEMRKKGRNK